MDQNGWRSLLKLLLATKDDKTLSSVLDVLLTPEEKDHLAMRCLIVIELLAEKKTQREIAKDLNVSIAQITRGSNQLKRISTKLKEYLATHLV